MKQKESLYLFKEAETEEREEAVESLKRRQPRPTKNHDVPDDLTIAKAISNVSTLTNEEPNPDHELSELLDDDPDKVEGFEDHNDERSQPEEVDVVKEEQLPESITFEQEQGVALAQEGEEPEHADVGFPAPKTDLIEEYDLTAEKPNGRHDPIENFDAIKNYDGGVFAAQKEQIDDVYDLTAEIYRAEEAVSPLKHEPEIPGETFLSPEESNQDENGISFIEEFVPEDTDYDVQTVLDKQNTHELFCPNCRSCITRRVILRRKRRRVPRFRPAGRGERITLAPKPYPTIPITEPEDQTPVVATRDVPADPAEDHPPHHRDPEVFRCLSCFSFFIPTGEGIKIFRIFEKKSEAGNVQEERKVSPAAVTESSFFSFFKRKKKPAVLKGSDAPEDTSENTTQQKSDSGRPENYLPTENVSVASINGNIPILMPSFNDAMPDSFPTENGSVPSMNGNIPSPMPCLNDATSEPKKVEESKADTFKQDAASSPKEPLSIITDQFNTYFKDPLPKHAPIDAALNKPDTLGVGAPSAPVTIVVGQTIVSIDQIHAKKPEEDFSTKNDHTTEVSLPSKFQSSFTEPKVVIDGVTFPVPPHKVKDNAVEEPDEPTSDSVIINVGTVVDSPTTIIADRTTDVENQPRALTQPLLGETRLTEVPEVRDFDVLKSIVYGGLVESITSLGVVSSAAGGGATTLNTLALALANIITGLFILIHNLRELKNESETNTEQDRYYRNLGRRGKFSLHVTVAIISFLVFGAVAPITYGFSFHISDNRDYKLIAVTVASLACVLLLSLGKARVTSKSYIKTALYYLMMGFAASGISFVVGILFDKLLERLGLFDSGSSITYLDGFISKTAQSGTGWASY